jgi:serine/threonine protein kinase
MRCFNPFCFHKSHQSGSTCKRCGQQLKIGSQFASEPIAEGGFGTIYLLQGEPNTISILKTPNSSVIEERQALSLQNLSLRQEAATLQALGTWPGCPRLKHFSQQEEWYYLIEEYIEGPTLKETAGVREIRETELWALLDALLELLEYLAQQGIVHRDIKPDNLILTGIPTRPLVLIDWGLASPLAQNWEPRLGNRDFVAPEVLEGHSCLKSDLYSLGKLMIYLLLLTSHEVSPRWSSHVPHLSHRLIEAINELWLHRKVPDAAKFRETFVPPAYRSQHQVLARIAKEL